MRKPAVQQRRPLMTEPAQQPPGTAGNRAGRVVVDDDLIAGSDTKPTECPRQLRGVGKRMAATVSPDRSSEVFIEMHVDSARNMSAKIVLPARVRLQKFEATVDDDQFRVAEIVIECLGRDKFVMMLHGNSFIRSEKQSCTPATAHRQ